MWRILLTVLWMIMPSHAGLVFERESITIDAPLSPKAQTLKGSYKFKNGSNNPLRIVKVRTSCGCTAAEPAKKVYAPDESGLLIATYEVNPAQRGSRSETITVVSGVVDDTSDPKGAAAAESETQLTLNVNIPEVLMIRPRFLFWKKGEQAETKSVTMTPSHKHIGILRVQQTVKDFVNYEIEVNEQKTAYILSAKPNSTSKRGVSTLKVFTDLKGWEAQPFLIFLYVK